MVKNLVATGLVAAVVSIGLGVFLRMPTVNPPLGASASPDHYGIERFFGDMTVGGNRISSSTSASVTLSGSEFNNASIMDYTVNKIGVTVTLPASTTPLCSSLGLNQRRTVLIRHASTTAANILTFAGSASIILKTSGTSTAASIYGDTDGLSYGQIEILRQGAGQDCVAFFTSFNDKL